MTNKALKMSGNQILIKQKVEEQTASGIIFAKEALKGGSMETFEGTVLAIGPSVSKYKPGDHVLFGKNVFASFYRYEEEYLLVYEPYVWGCEVELDEEDVTDQFYIVKKGDA